MKWTVVLTEGAERDINAAAVWYEGEASGLGRRFLDAVGVALAHIEDNPQQFQRRALLKRFPYGLYFRIESTSAVVVGCFHAHRNPTAWKSRQ